MLAVHEELDGAQLLLDVLGKVDGPLEGGKVELVAALPCQDSRVFLVAQACPRVPVVEDGCYVGPEVLLNLSNKRLNLSGRIELNCFRLDLPACLCKTRPHIFDLNDKGIIMISKEVVGSSTKTFFRDQIVFPAKARICQTTPAEEVEDATLKYAGLRRSCL